MEISLLHYFVHVISSYSTCEAFCEIGQTELLLCDIISVYFYQQYNT